MCLRLIRSAEEEAEEEEEEEEEEEGKKKMKRKKKKKKKEDEEEKEEEEENSDMWISCFTIYKKIVFPKYLLHFNVFSLSSWRLIYQQCYIPIFDLIA